VLPGGGSSEVSTGAGGIARFGQAGWLGDDWSAGCALRGLRAAEMPGAVNRAAMTRTNSDIRSAGTDLFAVKRT
jgi:hypothetical protein